MTTPSLLCRAQALYPFESNDPSSLKFDEGDYIDVLSKLPSGWWDGWCNGVRGWFPSNYVKVIQDYGVTKSVAGSPLSVQKYPTKRISTSLFDDRVGVGGSETNKRISLPPNWSIQNREDGSASYYFNTLTGEMRSTYPYEESTPFYEGDSDEDSSSSTIDSNSRSDSATESNYFNSDDMLNFTSNERRQQQQQQQQQGKWIQRTTSQGPSFFQSLSIQDTAWHSDSQEQGSPKTPKSLTTTRHSVYSVHPSPSFDSGESLSWNKLLLHITLTINNLIASSKSAQRSLYKKYATSVVEAIRLMLLASGTINKESAHIKGNNVLRVHHRSMMASVSKLVLSAQLCADGTVSDVSKLLSDCHELLIAVRNFVSTCEAIPIEIHYLNPTVLTSQDEKSAPWDQVIRRQNSLSSCSTMDHPFRNKYELQPDLTENLYAYGSSMQESMESLMSQLVQPSDTRSTLAVTLFTRYRDFGNQNGQFLSIIEDIDFEEVLSCPAMKKLALAKQKLFDCLGLLFFKMQIMTDETVQLETVIKDMQDAGKSIIDAIKQVCECMAELVAEKIKLNKENQKAKNDKWPGSGSKRNSIIHSADSTKGDSYPLSDFLRSSGSSQDLSFDLSLTSPIGLKSPIADEFQRFTSGSRLQSAENGVQPAASNSTKLNRSSAPTTESNAAATAESIKHRSHTLTESATKHAAKIKQFFGDDVPEGSSPEAGPPVAQGGRKSSTTSIATSVHDPSVILPEEEKQPFLQYDYDPSEIVFTVEGGVKGGTLPALVERMTLHDYLDMNYNNTFLLTYRSFCSSMQVLELLEARYNLQPPSELTPAELEIWVAKKQKLIRLRVFNVLKIWLEQYYYEEDSVILDRLLFFTNTSIKNSLNFSAFQLERLIHKRKDACKDLKKLVITQPQDSPEPILPRNLKRFKLLDVDPLELARQMTIMDFKLYSSIKPVECLDKAWSRDSSTSSEHHTPVAINIQASITYCNQVTTWVSDSILSQTEVKKRSMMIKYWVSVADRCRTFNNFNTCMAILSAFDNSAVGRLKRTWELVGARTHHIVGQMRKLMGANRNFLNYRGIIHSINPPCIPFLGIYLQDLTFIEDGNPNFLKTSKNLINFAKRAKTAEVIREIQQYQTMGYQLRPVDELQTFIVENLQNSRDEDQLYKESLKLEPKERDDEKIARLLQESGFL